MYNSNNTTNNNNINLHMLVEETESQRKQIEALNKELKLYKLASLVLTILLVVMFLNTDTIKLIAILIFILLIYVCKNIME